MNRGSCLNEEEYRGRKNMLTLSQDQWQGLLQEVKKNRTDATMSQGTTEEKQRPSKSWIMTGRNKQ